MNNSLISIIMPVYNSEKFIEKSIKSVLNQDYNNWELLIIDDCSTDKSSKIISTYSNKYKRIKHFKNEQNKGVSKSRNFGIKNAKGDYIAFLDSDDIWYNDKLSKQINFMKNNNYVFTFTAYEIIDENGKQKNKIIKASKEINYKKLLKGNNIGCFTVMIDKKIMENFLMPEIHHEDYATWLKILKKNYKAHGLNKILGAYRKREGSLSSNKVISSIWTFKIYKNYIGLSLFKSSYYFIFYIYNSIKKYML